MLWDAWNSRIPLTMHYSTPLHCHLTIIVWFGAYNINCSDARYIT